MPYDSNKELPEAVQKLPDHAQDIFRKAFNSAIDQGNTEESAFKIAWAAVKRKYKKNKDGDWVKAAEPVILSLFGPAQTVVVEGAEDDPAIAARSTIQIMRPGEWEHPDYGEFEVTQEDIDEFKENFDKNVRGVRLAVDVNHDDNHEAVGWLEELIDKGKKGLWAVIGWTKKGYELIKDGAYRYFSPEFAPTWIDPETDKEYENVLFGGAITNRPFIKNMAAIALSEDVIRAALDFYREVSDDGGDTDMGKEKPTTDFKQKAREKFGLTEKELDEILACEYTPPKPEYSLKYAVAELLEFWMKKLEAGDKDAAEEVEPIINNLQSLIKEGLDKGNGGMVQATQMVEEKEKPTKPETPNPDEGKDKTVKTTEVPAGHVMLSEDEVKTLKEQAKQGEEATRKLVETEVAGQAQTLIFSEANKKGLFKEESKDRITKFMLALSEDQRKEFLDILGEMPKANREVLLTEKGSGVDAPDLGDDKDHAKLTEEAKKLAEEKGITFKEALLEVEKRAKK